MPVSNVPTCLFCWISQSVMISILDTASRRGLTGNADGTPGYRARSQAEHLCDCSCCCLPDGDCTEIGMGRQRFPIGRPAYHIHIDVYVGEVNPVINQGTHLAGGVRGQHACRAVGLIDLPQIYKLAGLLWYVAWGGKDIGGWRPGDGAVRKLRRAIRSALVLVNLRRIASAESSKEVDFVVSRSRGAAIAGSNGDRAPT